eukprot:TRINITY_DN55061_c0_g1_i1.p1 TRINITY_DN55061_c0_g1~~TRINITY_DN55061_c0_g1_i1.p1  ORF type:complete len:894 (+),score=111.35 TRINITY_DN55061_c0_g1_i1:38-2683(+)
MDSPLLLQLKVAVKRVVMKHMQGPQPVGSQSFAESVGLEPDQLQQDGREVECLVVCLVQILCHGLYSGATPWQWISTLQSGAFSEDFPLASRQVSDVQCISGISENWRLHQWIRLALNEATLLSCLQLLSAESKTSSFYKPQAILRDAEQLAVLFGMLPPVGGMTWPDRLERIKGGESWLGMCPEQNEGGIQFALTLFTPEDLQWENTQQARAAIPTHQLVMPSAAPRVPSPPSRAPTPPALEGLEVVRSTKKKKGKRKPRAICFEEGASSDAWASESFSASGAGDEFEAARALAVATEPCGEEEMALEPSPDEPAWASEKDETDTAITEAFAPLACAIAVVTCLASALSSQSSERELPRSPSDELLQKEDSSPKGESEQDQLDASITCTKLNAYLETTAVQTETATVEAYTQWEDEVHASPPESPSFAGIEEVIHDSSFDFAQALVGRTTAEFTARFSGDEAVSLYYHSLCAVEKYFQQKVQGGECTHYTGFCRLLEDHRGILAKFLKTWSPVGIDLLRNVREQGMSWLPEEEDLSSPAAGEEDDSESLPSNTPVSQYGFLGSSSSHLELEESASFGSGDTHTDPTRALAAAVRSTIVPPEAMGPSMSMGEPVWEGVTFSTQLHASPSRKEIKAAILSQRSRCQGCMQPLPKEWSLTSGTRYVAKFCHYTGYFYCLECHRGQTSPIPALVLRNWDFKAYAVCSMSFSLINSLELRPIICVSAVNPQLFEKVPALKICRRIRLQLGLLYRTITSCPKFSLATVVNNSNTYYCKDTEMYTLADLKVLWEAHQITTSTRHTLLSSTKNPVLSKLKKIRLAFIDHIKNCTEHCRPCSSRPCALCSNPQPIFDFDVNNTVICPRCGRLFHRMCFITEPCRWCFPS